LSSSASSNSQLDFDRALRRSQEQPNVAYQGEKVAEKRNSNKFLQWWVVCENGRTSTRTSMLKRCVIDIHKALRSGKVAKCRDSHKTSDERSKTQKLLLTEGMLLLEAFSWLGHCFWWVDRAFGATYWYKKFIEIIIFKRGEWIVTNFFSYCFPSNKTSIFWFGDICGILKFVGPPPGLYGLTSKIILSDEFSYLKSLILEALSKLKTIYSHYRCILTRSCWIFYQAVFILKQILSPGARTRLNNIKMLKPGRSDPVEQYLLGMASQGKMNSQINDNQLKQILLSIQQPKRDFKINRIWSEKI